MEKKKLEFYECIIILPIHLFDIPKDITYDKLYIIEHPLYFMEYSYHVNKLILHRASMKNYAKNTDAEYIEFKYYEKKIEMIFKKYKTVAIFDPVSHTIYNDYTKFCKKYGCEFVMLKNPNFICSLEDLLNYKELYKLPSHGTFYRHFRKKYNILMTNNTHTNDKKSEDTHTNNTNNTNDKNNLPLGGKWSFDKENRLKFPDNYKETDSDRELTKVQKNDKILEEAIKYAHSIAHPCVLKYADIIEPFYLPYNQEETKKHFDKFIKKKLDDFGPYEDAARDDVVFGYHSVISPLMNIGLICPDYIIEKVSNTDCRIESKEGYIRQLFWREYCRYMYMLYRDEMIDGIISKSKSSSSEPKSSKSKSTKLKSSKSKSLKYETYFKDMKRPLTIEWFECSVTTGMSNVDTCIKKFAKYGYLHHIERLMHVGNFMLLNNIKPTAVYVWFMMFIDAYPWVMMPNVYGMSQFVSGPVMMTRPYFSSSNYIKNMSNFKSSEIIISKKQKKSTSNTISSNETNASNETNDTIKVKSFDVWDALFYRFVDMNKKRLIKNYATANFVNLWNSKSKAEQTNMLYLAELYIKNYK